MLISNCGDPVTNTMAPGPTTPQHSSRIRWFIRGSRHYRPPNPIHKRDRSVSDLGCTDQLRWDHTGLDVSNVLTMLDQRSPKASGTPRLHDLCFQGQLTPRSRAHHSKISISTKLTLLAVGHTWPTRQPKTPAHNRHYVRPDTALYVPLCAGDGDVRCRADQAICAASPLAPSWVATGMGVEKPPGEPGGFS